MSLALGLRSEMRLAMKEWPFSRWTRMVQEKNSGAVTGQSGVHWSPTRVLTGVTIGICSVSVSGTTRSGPTSSRSGRCSQTRCRRLGANETFRLELRPQGIGEVASHPGEVQAHFFGGNRPWDHGDNAAVAKRELQGRGGQRHGVAAAN